MRTYTDSLYEELENTGHTVIGGTHVYYDKYGDFYGTDSFLESQTDYENGNFAV